MFHVTFLVITSTDTNVFCNAHHWPILIWGTLIVRHAYCSEMESLTRIQISEDALCISLCFNALCVWYDEMQKKVKEIYLIYRQSLTGITIPGQSGPGTNGNEGITSHSPEDKERRIIIRFGHVSYSKFPVFGGGSLTLLFGI